MDPLKVKEVIKELELLRRPIDKATVLEILSEVERLFANCENVIQIDALEVISVCGDTHGQFLDVLNIFEMNGKPSDSNPYLWNGDIVDRGLLGVELALMLFCYKILYPNHVHITRGNHESRSMTSSYGFASETLFKYDWDVLHKFYEVFDALPIAALLNNDILVLHGGLFADDSVKIEDLNAVDRFMEPPHGGLMHDALWSDPDRRSGKRFNSQRGGGLRFGPDVTAKFLEENNLRCLIRSHEVRHQGYELEHNDLLITVFSAPNYGGMGNKGAFIHVKSSGDMEFFQFEGQKSRDFGIDDIKALYGKSKL